MKTVDKYQFNEDQCFRQDGIAAYVAVHSVLKKKFVIKMVTYGAACESEQTKYLTQESQILKKIAHEQIYRCHKLLRSKNNFYAVFDHLEGTPLSELTKALPLQAKASVTAQAFELLFALQARNIVNTNICPSNLVLLQDGKLILKNLGRAQEFEEDQKQKSVAFDKAYLSEFIAPEVLSGKVRRSSDLYSLGMLLTALFQSEFHKTEVIAIVLQKRGINVSLSIDSVKRMAQELCRKDSALRPELKEVLVSKKSFPPASPGKSEKAQSVKSNQGVRLKLPEMKQKQRNLNVSCRSSSNLCGSEERSRKKLQKFEHLLETIIKKRGLTIMFLSLADAVLSSNQAEVGSAIQLGFLLLKKAATAISQLKKLLSKGFNHQHFISEKALQQFQSEPSFKYFLEIVDHQMLSTQQRFQLMLGETHRSTQLSSNQQLQLQTKNEDLSESYFGKAVLQFLLQLSLLPTADYISQLKGDQLFYLYIFSLTAEFKTLEAVYELFFSQEVIEVGAQPFYLQVSLIPKPKLLELIEANTTKLYCQTSGSFDLSVITTKVKTMKSVK